MFELLQIAKENNWHFVLYCQYSLPINNSLSVVNYFVI